MSTESIELDVQKSFNRFGVPLAGCSIKIIGGVNGGYGVKHLSNTFFKQSAQAVLIEPDPEDIGKFMVSAVFKTPPRSPIYE
jgi:hypothetical protein